MSNPRITTNPQTAMEAAFNRAVQRYATQRPKQPPKPQPAQPPQRGKK